jgi:phosphomevalonate kinase
MNKTGLGSSAALISSLVAAMLSHFDICNPKSSLEDGLSQTARLAHVCHSLAQGKIGSGFDISSAVFGSQIYRRFSPLILDKLFVGDLQVCQSLYECASISVAK